jgi:hypothetical protein
VGTARPESMKSHGNIEAQTLTAANKKKGR